MKLHISASSLKDALKKLRPLYSGAPSALHISTGLFIDASEGKLALRGNNYETAISLEVPANVIDAEQVVIPFKPLADYIGVLDDNNISIETQPNNSILIAEIDGDARTVFNCLDPESFPIHPTKGELLFSIGAGAFAVAAGRAKTACAKNNYKEGLMSVMVKTTDKQVAVLATDSHRTHVSEIPVSSVDRELIIPSQGLAPLLPPSALFENDETMNIFANQGMVTFQQGKTELAVRLLVGKVLPYERLILAPVARRFICRSTEMCRAVAKVTAPTKYEGKQPLHVIIPKSEEGPAKINLFVLGSQVTSNAHNSIETNITAGESAEFMVNQEYFAESMDCLPKDTEITVTYSSSRTPIVVTAIDEYSNLFRAIIAPMSIAPPNTPVENAV